MRSSLIWMAVPLAAAVLLSPLRAAACTCVIDPIYHSDPVDGTGDVALNQAIMVEGVFALASIRLEDAEGHPVEVELNEGPWPGCKGTSADVLPKAPLRPNTRYVLHVESLYPGSLDPSQSSSLSFTTGSSMLADETPKPPSKAAASVIHTGPEGMCTPSTIYTCLGIDQDDGLELIIRKGDQVLMRTTTLVQNDGLYGLDAVPDCVELRRRSRTGKRSEPLSICGDALHARAYQPADADKTGFIGCHDGKIGAQAAAHDDKPVPLPDVSPAPPDNAAGSIAPPLAGSSARAGSSAIESPKPTPPAAAERHVKACAAASTPAHGSHAALSGMAAIAVAFIARRRARRAGR